MKITNEQCDIAFESATKKQRFLYSDPASGRRLQEIASKHKITEGEQYKNYAILVGDVVLNLRLRTELPKDLSETLNISHEQALKITADLTDFLDQDFVPIASTDDLTDDIAETEAALEQVHNIPHIRTMARDMQTGHGVPEEITYTSSQESLLRRPDNQ
ncbi:MAG: hypothetical protein RLZZ230_245 [Candidatus Parcubacteria bacterium]|jgi:hypothetical protein